MKRSPPAQHAVDNPPGQIVNPIPRHLTLGGIIDRVNRSEGSFKKKLTFRDWAVEKCYLDVDNIDLMEEAFNAGKENA